MNSDARRVPLRALVVDDEPNLQRLTSAALTAEGFCCDLADDGAAAWRRIQEAPSPYDLVVTDLAMPNRNGHAFIVDLLKLPVRPFISVLTGITEPKLAKDLIRRGVDEVSFKPIQFIPYAAKTRALVDRHRRARDKGPSSSPSEPATVTAMDFAQKMHKLTRIPTVSQAALEVFKLTSQAEVHLPEVAAAVERDPALIADVLRMANSAHFNPSSKKIWQVDQAVSRLGIKRVGELALAGATHAAVTHDAVPFFCLAKAWRRSLAAGICLEILLEKNRGAVNPSGLFCSAVLQPMARMMIASAFPDDYRDLLKHCHITQQSLAELEERTFPQSIGDAAAAILESWELPVEVYRPLRYAFQPFADLPSLGEPLRQRVEMVKVAGFFGELAVGEFEAYDRIDLPSMQLLKRLNIHSVDDVLQQCADNLQQATKPEPEKRVAQRELLYKRFDDDSVDFMPHLFGAVQIRLVEATDEISNIEDVVLINALNSPVHHLPARIRTDSQHDRVVLTTAEAADRAARYGRVVALPCSYASLVGACAPGPARRPAVLATSLAEPIAAAAAGASST